MFTRKKRKRIQRTLALSGLFLAVYFVAVYHPLSKRARNLDGPLTDVWRQLAACTLEVHTGSAQDLPKIGEALQLAQKSTASLDRAGRALTARVALEAPVRARMDEPFQLIDFQNERQLRIEELDRLARQQQIKLGPAVAEGFPEYTADMTRPALLWAQLALARELISAAIHCKITQVTALKLPAIQSHAASGSNGEFLDEIPVIFELTGSMTAVSRLLRWLPLRVEEAKALGLPDTSPAKPALFIDRILLRKSAPDKPDEVHAELRICGFVFGS